MSDDLVDPNSGLMTPLNFYESARRIKSWADRKQQPICFIAIELPNLDEDNLVRVAREMLNELRGGDLLVRMGKQVFVLLILGDEVGAGHLIFRLSNKIKPKLEFRSQPWLNEETLIDLLKRLGV